MRITSKKALVALVAMLLIVPSSTLPAARAQTLTQLLLVSGNGPIGTLDPITEFSINGTTWSPATIVQACCQLGQSLVNYDVIPGTQLIARNSNGTTPTTPTTLYRVFFTLPQSFLTPMLALKMHADNVGTVSLNGNLVGSQPGNPTPVSSNFLDPPSLFLDVNSAHFQPGQNEIRFSVLNFGGPSILDYEAQITFATPPAGTVNPSCANPTLLGTPNNDVFAITGGGPYVVDLGAGDDVILIVGTSNDTICGGPGNDRIVSGDGNDLIFGDAGNDTMDAGPGNDFLTGGAGDDAHHGNTGIDLCFDFLGTNTFSQCP